MQVLTLVMTSRHREKIRNNAYKKFNMMDFGTSIFPMAYINIDLKNLYFFWERTILFNADWRKIGCPKFEWLSF